MTNKTLFLVRTDAVLVPMAQSAPADEDELQLLIERYPELIGGSADSLLLVQREQPVPDSLESSGRWSIDHLFVTREGVPVLVEVKRASDTRIRREVVGQMLDYAANGVAYWPPGSLKARFESWCAKSGRDPDDAVAAFLGGAEQAGDFWTRVDDNLRAGRIRLLFVADLVPPELARIVEFMNDQMRAEVLAIELNYYSGPEGVRLLAPKVIGETERTRALKDSRGINLPSMTVEEWVNKHIAPRGPAALEGSSSLLALMRSLFPEVNVASTQGSVYSAWKTPSGNSYPLFLTKAGTCQIGFGYLAGSPALADDAAKKRFYDRFSQAVGPLASAWKPGGFPSFKVEILARADMRQAFEEVAREYADACKAG